MTDYHEYAAEQCSRESRNPIAPHLKGGLKITASSRKYAVRQGLLLISTSGGTT